MTDEQYNELVANLNKGLRYLKTGKKFSPALQKYIDSLPMTDRGWKTFQSPAQKSKLKRPARSRDTG